MLQLPEGCSLEILYNVSRLCKRMRTHNIHLHVLHHHHQNIYLVDVLTPHTANELHT